MHNQVDLASAIDALPSFERRDPFLMQPVSNSFQLSPAPQAPLIPHFAHVWQIQGLCPVAT